jgi:Tfp pilus assembly protein PilX
MKPQLPAPAHRVSSPRRAPARQRGAALVVSLIMLMLITLLAVASFRLGKGNLQIVGNAQQRSQGLAAAQGAIDQVVSSIQFTVTPASPIPVPGGTTNTVAVDVNGDGVADISVAVAAQCDSIQPIPVTALDFTNSNDRGCTIQQNQDFGIPGASTNNSMCSNSIWDINASTTDLVTNANFVIDEGAAVRVSNTTTCP